MNYHEGDLIICIVKDVVKTTVFVETESGVKGSIVFSEIAPGRIRNIREYVVPNKIIVCKVLDSRDNHLFLSLRRVKEKERKELIEQYKKEKSYNSIFRKILGEDSEKIINKIKTGNNLIEFIEKARKEPKLLEKYFDKSQVTKIEKVISEKKEKAKEIKQEFVLKCKEPNGIKDMDEFLKEVVLPTRFKSIEIIDNEVLMIAGSNQNKANLFGRNKKRYEELKRVVEDIFNLNLRIV